MADFKIKQQQKDAAGPRGGKQYGFHVRAPDGTSLGSTGYFYSKGDARDALNVMLAKYNATERGEPVNIRTNYGTEVTEVAPDPGFIGERQQLRLENELRDLAEDPNNPGYNLRGDRMVSQEEFLAANSLARRGLAVADPALLEATKTEYSSVRDLLKNLPAEQQTPAPAPQPAAFSSPIFTDPGSTAASQAAAQPVAAVEAAPPPSSTQGIVNAFQNMQAAPATVPTTAPATTAPMTPSEALLAQTSPIYQNTFGDMAGSLSNYYANLYGSDPYFQYYGTPYMYESVFDSGVYDPSGEQS